MSAAGPRPPHRRWWAPEVVQTSGMDCGPAALKCLLDGHGVPVSYGRLREACQTDVDGTSIDTLEVVARQLGLDAQQQMLPADQLLPDAWGRGGSIGRDHALPALVVVRHADVATHFVVVWRRLGDWLQVMDPAFGRHWVQADRLRADLVRHEATVPASAWRAWAGETAPQACWHQGLRAIGLDAAAADQVLARAAADAGWRGLATLDATLRLVRTLCRAGGVAPGPAAGRLLQALIDRCDLCDEADTAALASVVPEADWSVLPAAPVPAQASDGNADGDDAGDTDPLLRLRGAVLLQVAGLRAQAGMAGAAAPDDDAETLPPLSPELAAALTERPPGVLATVAQVLRADGLLAPLALAAALLLATGAVLLETLLLRGLLDVAGLLQGPGQTLGALAALLAFMAALTLLDWPIARELLRHGRQLDTRLRLALLQKLPRLNDRYFQSRPVSDMADRAHALHLLRGVPALGFQLLQAVAELLVTAAAVLWLAPHSAGWTLALLGTALALPWLAQPALRERDLRARHHQSALTGFHLDALLALPPVRAHRAQANVAAQHESLLLAWTEALRSSQRIGMASQGLQALVGTGLAAALVLHQVQAAGGWAGTDLLLAFWALKLPALGGRLSALAQQLPGQRNVLQRLMEPLGAPDDQPAAALETAPAAAPGTHPAATPGASPAAARLAWHPGAPRGLALQIDGGQVIAGGHSVLQGLQLQVAAGDHVAIVGSSGAGKSSLLGVLLGWHRLTEGRLLVDGQPMAPGDVAALRAVTAWVDPAVQLWNRSLLDNLTDAAAPDDRLRLPQVIAAARLRGVLARLPQGLQTPLGEGGARLSGGEGQRVRLARAMLASDTRLVLLDEPFRGLDHAQRQALLADARAWWQQHTLLCVTHDVGDTLGFDRVLVVHGGGIVEDGPPRQLAAQDSRYSQLLQAEDALRQQLWGSAAWRRLRLSDGRLVEATPAQAAPAAAQAGVPP